MRRQLAALRHPTVQAFVLGAALCFYTVVLLIWNFRAEQQVHASAAQSLRLEVEKRAQTVGYLFQRWQADVQRLARSPEIANYYTNKALGMSMEYGLHSSIILIKERFREFVERPFGEERTSIERVALIELDGTVLAAFGHTPNEASLWLDQHLRGTGRGIHADPEQGVLTVHAAVHHEGDLRGNLVVWMAPQIVAELALGVATGSGVAGDYLIRDDGQPVLPFSVDPSMRDLADRLVCSKCAGGLHNRVQTPSNDACPALTILTAAVPSTHFALAMVRASADVFPARTSPALLATAGALPLVAIIALVVITRIRQTNRDLKVQFDVSLRKEQLLRAEISRRERVEGELRDNQDQLRERGHQLQKAMDDAHKLAFYDPLTGLANRVLFRERLANAIDHAKRDNLSVALLFLDLDRFKRINDTLGHHIGDLLLQKVAARLKHSVRSRDIITKSADDGSERILARQGGDEFTVVLAALRRPEHVSRAAQRVAAVVAKPMILEGLEVSVTASIGISICPSDDTDVEALIRNADAAMYTAKARGGNTFCFFQRSMNDTARQRLEQESDLRKALQQGELSVYFQPQVDLGSGQVIGAEALVRWKHPEKGMIIPGQFIATAEEARLINPLTELVLEAACVEAADWPKVCGKAPRVAVNLSGQSFVNYDICGLVERTLRTSRLSPERLELEITETVLLENRASAAQVLDRVNRLGVRTAIDDFGTGYSSLSYLKSFPIQGLKIDRSFVADVEEDGNDAAIVRAIIALAESLGMETIAEGVETPNQQAFLKQAGCAIGQGFLYSRPLPAAAFRRFLGGSAKATRVA